jgi:hypothetical protein
MKGRIRVLGVVTALGLSAVAGAGASTVHAAVGKHPPPAALATPTKPTGYKVVISSPFTAAAATQTHGTVTCPLTKKGVQTEPTGGGALVSGTDTALNINSSYPSGAGWAADVNNAGGTDTQFEVIAACSLPTKGYTAVVSLSPGTAGVQSRGTANCPKGTKVLGGGALSDSPATSDNINSSFPSGNSWIVDMNNGSGTNTGFSVYVVCSKYPAKTGYQVVAGSAVDNPSGAQSLALAACPSGTVPLGGGALSGSGSTSVNLNTTYPSNPSWASYENNTSGNDAALTSYAICAH